MTITDFSTLAELRTAQDNARIAHKKAILRSDTRAATAAISYLRSLEAQYEDALDAEQPIPERHDNSANYPLRRLHDDYPFRLDNVDKADLAYGYHVDRHKYGTDNRLR